MASASPCGAPVLPLFAESAVAVGERGEVYSRAARVRRLAQIACECATHGRGCDVARAERLLAEIAQIAGGDA